MLANLGRRDESLALLRAVVSGRRTALGPAHPLTLRARASLLEMLPASEVVAEEGGALLSLSSECARLLGSDHTVTLGTRHNHAWALYLLGRFGEADDEIRLVAEAYVRRFGPEYRSCSRPGSSTPGPVRARSHGCGDRADGRCRRTAGTRPGPRASLHGREPSATGRVPIGAMAPAATVWRMTADT
ncbi:tetratricopeptide repeat protein [Streptomyces shenzhenensis]|uniref:tetratricopeptide repeat protein n=1 Tax=Streptomyces shenzhenensis TaxID=943815 RepID=UPI0038D4AC35